jgi:hypothetical protein
MLKATPKNAAATLWKKSSYFLWHKQPRQPKQSMAPLTRNKIKP